jgi:tetratricopeptide (TPR) repeat protein
MGRSADAAPILDRAIAGYHESIRLKPDDAAAHYNLGNALKAQGKVSEAIAAFRAAIQLRPDVAWAHGDLGLALSDQGKLSEAIVAFRAAIRLKPDDAGAHVNLANALRGQGKVSEAIAAHREAIRLQPDLGPAHGSLGVALHVQGKMAEAIAEYREAIRLRPDFALTHYALGIALSDQGKLDEAVAEYREAIRFKPDYAEAHCNLGDVLKRQERFRDSRDEYRRGHELGSKQPDWRYPSAEWVRQAERLMALEARLPALLRGEDHAAVHDFMALAQMCYDTKRHAAASRFWAEALAADPKLADDRQAGHRYDAACAAALAGAGRGTDDPKPDDAARAKLRVQALDWLKAELAAWAKVLDSADAQARLVVLQTLEHWRADSDLAGIRDPDALAQLPEAERAPWRSLWANVDALLARTRGGRP